MRFALAILGLVISSAESLASNTETLYHAEASSYGCSTSQATHDLLNPPNAYRYDQAWFRSAFDQGHCVTITTKSPWKLIYVSGDMAFMSYAGTIGAPGSYYFSTSAMVDADGHHPSSTPPVQLLPPKPAPQPTYHADAPPKQVAPHIATPKPVSPPTTAFAPSPAYGNSAPTVPAAPSTSSHDGSGGGWIVFIGIGLFVYLIWRSTGAAGKKKPTQNGQRSAQTPLRTGSAIARPAGFSTAPNATTRNVARWYQPGEEVRIHNTVVKDGMVYVGTSLFGSSAGYGQDLCLINPSLPVAAGPASDMPYWPSYSHISAQNRNAYLTWLGNGKSDPNANTGYVFLYFYGIERRLIAERPPKDEALLLIAELRRLLPVYGGDHSFKGYADSLIATAEFLYAAAVPATSAPNAELETLTIDREVVLSSMCRDGKPLSFDWVALWARDQIKGTNVWSKCRSDYLELARRQFEIAYPTGLVYRPNVTSEFKCQYHPASRSITPNFDDIVKVRFGADLPAVDHGPPSEVMNLFKKAESRLQRYADFRVRHPGTKDSPLALANLPAEIRDTRLLAADVSFKSWIDGLITASRGFVTVDQVWSCFYGQTSWIYDKSSWEELAKLLERYRYGLIPDPLFNDIPQLHPDQSAVLFRVDNEKALRAAPQPDFITGQSIAFIAADFARVSGITLPATSVNRLREALAALGLADAEQARIVSSLPWYEIQGQTRGRLKKTLDHLVPPRRATVLTAAAEVLKVSGAEPGQLVTYLEKSCTALAVDKGELYSALHHTSAPSTSPAGDNVVSFPSGYKIPKPPASASKAAKDMVLDPSRIKTVLADTEDVQDALSKVLFDAETPPAPKLQGSVDGLPTAQSELLKRLLQKTNWTRTAFEAITRELGLMPDGALEALNEWAFDNFDEALIEEGDPLVISPTCVEALTAKNAELARA